MIKCYVASSWRNSEYPDLVQRLREQQFEVLDWRNPSPGNHGFAWQQIDENWKAWGPTEYRLRLSHKIAVDGFTSDYHFMEQADICILLLPCGKSAHLEAGWFIGMQKPTYILLEDSLTVEPELMYKLADKVCLTIEELLEQLEKHRGT